MSLKAGLKSPGAGLGEASAATLATAVEIEALYHERFLPLVRRAVRRHGLSNDDARDVVQQVFVVALAKMEAAGNADAWLKQVVDFLAVNLKRTASRRARLLARWAEAGETDGARSTLSSGEEG